MNDLSLKQLRYFEALARHGHFGRAAEACAISQPALSVQIREMEQSLGMPLFERGPRHVRLTGFGETVADRVREILRGVDELSEMARAARPDLAGPLRVGVIPTVAPYLLPALLGRLARRAPGLDIRLRESVTPRLLQELAEGRLDTAILALPISGAALAQRPLFREEFVLVRPAEEAQSPVPEVEALPAMRLLLLEEGHCFRDQALAVCRMASARPRDMLEGSSLTTLVQMVSAGLGVTLIPEMAVPVEARSASVATARLRPPRPVREIGMIWRRTSPLAGQLDTLAEAVRAAAAEVTGAGSAVADAPADQA